MIQDRIIAHYVLEICFLRNVSKSPSHDEHCKGTPMAKVIQTIALRSAKRPMVLQMHTRKMWIFQGIVSKIEHDEWELWYNGFMKGVGKSE